MPSTQRGEGRAAMIQAAADCLLAGDEVKVLDIAEKAGVRHTLIYRHFPDGGRDELIAEAYAQLFRGSVVEDLQLIRTLSSNPQTLRDQLRTRYRQTLSPARDEIRWARLEALSKARSNPYIFSKLEATRKELLDLAVNTLDDLTGWELEPASTRAFAVLMLGIPLGSTPMLGRDASRAERNALADIWADMVVGFLHPQ
jgi:AcrR family transcriptional regulator